MYVSSYIQLKVTITFLSDFQSKRKKVSSERQNQTKLPTQDTHIHTQRESK